MIKSGQNKQTKRTISGMNDSIKYEYKTRKVIFKKI